jgi:hypothetical protein
MQTRLNKMTFKLHEQREKLAPSLELRRKYIEASYLSQIRGEKEMIQSRIDRLSPGVRKVFLASRLQKLNSQLNKL